MAAQKNNQLNGIQKSMSDARIKYFIQMLDVKRDKNMTRVFSAIKQSKFLNQNQ